MIRTNRVKTMTRAAIFEKREERRALYISRFFRGDYILYGVIKSAVSLTFAFLLGTCMWVIYHSESLMTEKTIEDLFELAMQALGWYGLSLTVFVLISVAVYAFKYHNAQKRLRVYRSSLRKLLKIYQEDGAAKERTI